MEDTEKRKLIQRLGELMSEISEECYYAGWLSGTEYFVPELCRRARDLGKPQTWGHGEVGPQKAEELFRIAELLGHWVDLNEMGSGYDPHDPFPIPPEYLESLDREPNG